jgi:hypothetical protein
MLVRLLEKGALSYTVGRNVDYFTDYIKQYADPQKIKNTGTGRVTQVVVCRPSKCEALSSNSSTTIKKIKTTATT